MQPRISFTLFAPRAHCWLMFYLETTRTSRSFSAKLLSRWVTPTLILVQNFALFVELKGVPVSPLFQLVSVPLDGIVILWCISYCSQSWGVPSTHLLRVCFAPSSWSLWRCSMSYVPWLLYCPHILSLAASFSLMSFFFQLNQIQVWISKDS